MDGPCRAMWVQCNHVLPLGVLDVLGATDLKGPEVVDATLTYPVAVAKKCWESNVSGTVAYIYFTQRTSLSLRQIL